MFALSFYVGLTIVALLACLVILIGIIRVVGLMIPRRQRVAAVRMPPAVTAAPAPSAPAPTTPASVPIAGAPVVLSAGAPFGAVAMPPMRQLSKRERNAILMAAARRQDKIAGRS